MAALSRHGVAVSDQLGRMRARLAAVSGGAASALLLLIALVLSSSSPAGAAGASGAAGSAAGAVGNPPASATLPSPVCLPRTAPVATGPATFVGQSTVPSTGGRVLDITLDSPAMGDRQHVNVLLPRGYDPSGRTRYPVLYLLHGASGKYSDWVNQGVEADIDYTSVADHLAPFITVMPDGGTWGFYSDWYGSDLNGQTPSPPPAYSTYHIDELIPWVDGHFPTVASRSGRAIAGLSMGGFGAMSYAARFPDLFAAAGSFSGAVDPDLVYPFGPLILNMASTVLTEKLPDQCIWGDPVTQTVRWYGADPTYLAQNLAPVSLFVASGDGQPGVFDTPGSFSSAGDSLIETAVFAMNLSFTAALDAAHVTHTTYFYGNGTHSWGYWLRDLAHFLPQMSGVFSAPPPAGPAAPFNYRTVETNFSMFGYSFSINHPAEGFTYLQAVSPTGLGVAGSGTLSVVTPATYAPGGSYRISVTASGPAGSHATTETAVADGAGHLAFTVGLGPSSALQQVNFSPTAPDALQHAQVSIAAE
jgi:S-formylglutathione hydrolase FrmB